MFYNMGVDQKTVQALLTLNRVFYQTFAANFSDTRMRIQPGVRRILASISVQDQILDLGCGNGAAAISLASQEYRGEYLGLDFSSELLAIARRRLADYSRFYFIQADLGTPGWDELGGFAQGGGSPDWQFNCILAFAVLHHLPGRDLHIQTCQSVNRLLVKGGQFIHSNWQFLNSSRLRKRIQPWGVAGLDPASVDSGDYLLDWRQGGRGLRYVHHFYPEELAGLAQKTGFKVVESFYSDGEGGNLGLYQIWQKENDVF
jgi:SAM-dependent methyltransferase